MEAYQLKDDYSQVKKKALHGNELCHKWQMEYMHNHHNTGSVSKYCMNTY